MDFIIDLDLAYILIPEHIPSQTIGYEDPVRMISFIFDNFHDSNITHELSRSCIDY